MASIIHKSGDKIGSRYAICHLMMSPENTVGSQIAKIFPLRWFIFLVIFITSPAWANISVPLAWNPSVNTNVAGYKIYFGVVSHDYTNSIDVGNVTNTTITGLTENTVYYFAATTYDSTGVESAFSNEATYLFQASPPTLNAVRSLSINENAGLQTINLTGISPGAGQTATITAVSSNPTLIPNPAVNYTGPASTGTLNFISAKNASGNATITVTVNNGLAQNNVVTQTFTVNVAAVNQPPTLNPIGALTLNYASPAQTVSLSGISSGAPNEFQRLTVTAVSSNPKLISNPAVTYSSPLATGTLTFKPTANASGAAIITVTVNDGGTSNNIVRQSFTVTVNPKSTAVAKPELLNKLNDQVVMAGKTVTLKVSADGKGPLKYQWKCNGTNVPGATSPTLTLKKVTAKESGLYTVTVSNQGGSTVSTPAVLAVSSTPAAILTSSANSNGQFTFNVVGVSGYKYAVQASTDFVNWTSVETNTSPFTFQDANDAQFNQRFYRTVYVPAP